MFASADAKGFCCRGGSKRHADNFFFAPVYHSRTGDMYEVPSSKSSCCSYSSSVNGISGGDSTSPVLMLRLLGCRNGVLTRRPLSSRPMTQRRPINYTQNQFRNTEVATTVKYQVCSAHTRPVYIPLVTPVPDTSVCWVRQQYRYRKRW